MRRSTAAFVVLATAVLLDFKIAAADGADKDQIGTDVDSVGDVVRVVVVKSGGEHSVQGVSGGSSGEQEGCSWTLMFVPGLDDVTYGMSAGPRPHPEAQLALLLCDGTIVQPIWVAPDDVIDLDAAARDEALRYVEDVLVPDVRIGVNPAARGLVGLDSWFWIDGFDGSVTAPPISAFGLTIDVRMSSGTVTWDFGDGTVESGDLGRPYPVRSTVRHVHQRESTYAITASIDLVPEYRVDGGPWITLPNLQAEATTSHAVEEREAVITQT